MAKSTIGQFIAALRKANGMTQQEVGERLNVSNKTVSRWERDECAPDLSLIPALAEMFGVTCDELLKGERIFDESKQEKKEPKVEKQIKNLINRTLSGFKTMIWISIAVSIVGLICMFGISYGFYRPVIGFAVMLLFEVCALVIAILAVSRTKDVKNDNELFNEADELLVAKYNNTLGVLSFTAFFIILAVVLLSLPLVIMTDSYYIESVLSIQSYLTLFVGGIALILLIIFLKAKKPYMEWISGNKLQKEQYNPIAHKVHIMTAVQMVLTFLAALIFVTAPYLETEPTNGFSLFGLGVIGGITCLIASIVCFGVFIIKYREEHKAFLLPGIRNVFLIPSALIISKMHHVGWWMYSERGGEDENILLQPERYDIWKMEYLWLALALAIIVFAIFSLIDVLAKRKAK